MEDEGPHRKPHLTGPRGKCVSGARREILWVFRVGCVPCQTWETRGRQPATHTWAGRVHRVSTGQVHGKPLPTCPAAAACLPVRPWGLGDGRQSHSCLPNASWGRGMGAAPRRGAGGWGSSEAVEMPRIGLWSSRPFSRCCQGDGRTESGGMWKGGKGWPCVSPSHTGGNRPGETDAPPRALGVPEAGSSGLFPPL